MNARPLLIQNLERQEISDDTNQQMNSIMTKEPSDTVGVLPNLTLANSATAGASKEFSGVSGVAEVEGLRVKTETQETSKTGSTTGTTTRVFDTLPTIPQRVKWVLLPHVVDTLTTIPKESACFSTFSSLWSKKTVTCQGQPQTQFSPGVSTVGGIGRIHQKPSFPSEETHNKKTYFPSKDTHNYRSGHGQHNEQHNWNIHLG